MDNETAEISEYRELVILVRSLFDALTSIQQAYVEHYYILREALGMPDPERLGYLEWAESVAED